jgi:trans-aconitate 2-methyltransferase
MRAASVTDEEETGMRDWDGEGYEQISDLQRHMALRSMAGLVLTGDEKVLDVGCGDGYVTRLIASRLPRGRVVGVDASPRMIEVASTRPIPPGASLRFELCDVRALPFDHEFDLVVSFNVLHWVVDQRDALTAIATSTTPGGRVIIQMVCAGPRQSLENVAMQVCARPAWSAAFADFVQPYIHVQPLEYAEIASAAGLLVTSQDVSDVEWDFGSRESFTRWCTVGFTDWTARLQGDDVSAWVEEVVSDYERLVGRPGLFRFMQLRAEMAPTR